MIEVTVRVNGEDEVAYIRIENVTPEETEYADYSIHFAVDRALGAVGVHQRGVAGFPRLRYNALALVRQALATLEPYELELEHGTSPSDLARRFSGARRSLPREATNPEHHHRPSFWRR